MKWKISQIVILVSIVLCRGSLSFGQKISEKDFIEQTGETILIENFYQIDVNDYINFYKPSSTGFFEKDKCYIQNFQSENKLNGQLLIQIDFSGRIQYIGISKIFIDRYNKISKPKMILVHSLGACTSGVNSNWQIANCISKRLIEFISD